MDTTGYKQMEFTKDRGIGVYVKFEPIVGNEGFLKQEGVGENEEDIIFIHDIEAFIRELRKMARKAGVYPAKKTRRVEPYMGVELDAIDRQWARANINNKNSVRKLG